MKTEDTKPWYKQVWPWLLISIPAGALLDRVRVRTVLLCTQSLMLLGAAGMATLVLSESDRQRLWKRAHRGADASARLLSGITSPSAEEKQILADLVRELEAGR